MLVEEEGKGGSEGLVERREGVGAEADERRRLRGKAGGGRMIGCLGRSEDCVRSALEVCWRDKIGQKSAERGSKRKFRVRGPSFSPSAATCLLETLLRFAPSGRSSYSQGIVSCEVALQFRPRSSATPTPPPGFGN